MLLRNADPNDAKVLDQDSNNNVQILAASIVYARNGDTAFRDKVVAAVQKLVAEGDPRARFGCPPRPGYPPNEEIEVHNRTLAWGREIGAYVLAADLVDYRTPEFETWIRNMAEVYLGCDDRTMRLAFQQRPNNWGFMNFGSLVAMYAFLGDGQALMDIRDYFIAGITGPNPGYSYGDLSWHPNANNPRLINPLNATLTCADATVINVDGLIPDDQRRSGVFDPDTCNVPAPDTHITEWINGAIMGARILDRIGMPVWDVGDQALKRMILAHVVAQPQLTQDDPGFKCEDDAPYNCKDWVLPILNEAYDLTLPFYGTGASKNAGYGAYVVPDAFPSTIEHAIEFASQQLEISTQAISSTQYPTYTDSFGSWNTDDAGDWRSGFFPGSLWYLHEWSPGGNWKTEAESRLAALEGEKFDTSTHDVGFKIFTSFGNAYRLTDDVVEGEDYRQVILTGAGSLDTRYDEAVKAIRSWNRDPGFWVVIDNMMNLEILFWASKNGGGSELFDHAVQHADKTLEHHVREDGSTYQVVIFHDDGSVMGKRFHQGLSLDSTWSRGQAWAVYGFTMAYRETGYSRFLETARKTADFFINNLPADNVPFWDFDVTSGDLEDKDSSAAAIAASGLLELSHLETDSNRSRGYLFAARNLLTALSSAPYLAEGTGNAAILLHGTQNRNNGNFDTGLIYGDYYFVEALRRYQRPFGRNIADGTPADVAVDISLAASDVQECELAFSIVNPPLNGSLGPLTTATCIPGSPNKDSTTVTYTPNPGFTGADAFTDKVNDGTLDSHVATVSLTVDSQEITLTLVADAKVKSTSTSRNYGTESTLRLRGGRPEWRTYLKFDVAGLSETVTSAKLRLYVTDEGSLDGSSVDGGTIYVVDNSWIETGVTWSNAPPISGSPLDSVDSITSGTWVEYDVTSAVSGNGTVSFGMTSQSKDSALFSSKEGDNPPELVVSTR